MDHLVQVIHSLSPDDQKAFPGFINRLRKKNNRKDLELYHLVLQHDSENANPIVEHLYKRSPNKAQKEAYYANRKRLLRHLSDFIIIRSQTTDPSKAASILGKINLARYLFENDDPGLGWKYLIEAEDQAINGEHYDLLNSIYNLQIENYSPKCRQELTVIIDKRMRNKQMEDALERANIACAVVKQQLEKYRLQPTPIDFEKLVKEILQTYALDELVSTRPRLLYKIISISRSAILAKKDFYAFEPYLISQYKMLANNGFNPSQRETQLGFLYMIAHTLYRNRKFEESSRYLAELQALLLMASKGQQARYYPRYIQLLAANKVFGGALPEGIRLLTDALADPKIKLSHQDRLNMLVNLGVYHFQQDDLDLVHQCFLEINHSDGWCTKIMGSEWVLKKNFMEVMLYFDLELTDLAESRIRSIERKFKPLFDSPNYGKAATFLRLLKQVIQDPNQLKDPGFQNRVDTSFEWLPLEQEDLQEMAFYAWLKSKMQQRPYREVLLELAKG